VVKTDEIKKYLDCRYVSTSKAKWHIFKFDMHERFPTIERLQYHLPNQQMVTFANDNDVQEVATWLAIYRTMLTDMVQNKPRIRSCTKPYVRSNPLVMGVELEVEAMDNAQERLCHWLHVLCTLTSDEHYYLRMLLNCVKGATSYEHLWTMDGREHDTFKDACIAMGLLADDNEWDQALEEAGVWASGQQLHVCLPPC
jgi:hypothetical protein